MIKPLVMSFALSGLGVNAVWADDWKSDPTTWRWHVSQILGEQRAGEEAGFTSAGLFDQRYERYSVAGSTRVDAK